MHSGHRSRMKAKLIAYGNEIFEDYELLEMLIYFGVSRRDTNPIAKMLIRHFGTLENVLSASREELLEVENIGEECADLIASVGDIHSLLGVELGSGSKECFKQYTRAGEFFTDHFYGCAQYDTAIMLLDNGMNLLGAFTIFRNGDYGLAKIEVDKIVRCALEAKATAVITAHTHPFGPLFPSPEDRVTNNAITDSLSAIGILHIEHFVVCGSRYIGIMRHLKERFAATAEIYEFMESRERAVAEGLVEDGSVEVAE